MCSKFHCVVFFKKDRLYVRDFYSASGTYLNGVRIPPFSDMELKEKDVISIQSAEANLQPQHDSVSYFVVHHIHGAGYTQPIPLDDIDVTPKNVCCPYCNN